MDDSDRVLENEIERYKQEIARLRITMAVMERQLVDRDRRDDHDLIPRRLTFLGIDSVTSIPAGVTASLPRRPQLRFRPVCLWTRGQFLINDFRIGNYSIFIANGPVHAECFNRPYRMILDCPIVNVGTDVMINVTNLEPVPVRFVATVWGELDWTERKNLAGVRYPVDPGEPEEDEDKADGK